MTEITCACGCGRKKEVRTADVKRGWGKYYSKSCKAKTQSKKMPINRGKQKQSRQTRSRRYQALCDAHDDGRISDEYFWMTARDEYSEFMTPEDDYEAIHTLDVHPFSSEGLGQWDD